MCRFCEEQTVYVYNEELRTETDVVDLVQTEGVQPPSETQIELCKYFTSSPLCTIRVEEFKDLFVLFF